MKEDIIARNWRQLIRPRRLETEAESDGETYGRFWCEPFERGFGQTLGNALRRVLLSALQGAAVTSLKVEGVPHEFHSIPGVLEDVSDIVLNLKETRLRMHVEGPKTVRIAKSGKGALLAREIADADSAIDVLNPKHKIATLSGDAELRLELTVDLGKGYRPADQNKNPEGEAQSIGTIPVDSIFSPVRRVNYSVTPARVGRATNYDRLNLEVWTDGSVAPVDAVAFGAKILKEHLGLFINFDEPQESALPALDAPELANPNLYRPVEDLGLSERAANCMKNASLEYIGELVQKGEADLLKIRNFGRKTLNEVGAALEKMELHLGMHLPNFPTRKELDQRARERE